MSGGMAGESGRPLPLCRMSCIPARKNKLHLPQSELPRIGILYWPFVVSDVQHRFFPETAVRWFGARIRREPVPALRIGSASAGCEGSMAMPLGTTCDCTLCHIEARLLRHMAVAEGELFADFVESSRLRQYTCVSDLLLPLRALPADARSDELLRELFRELATRPAFVESLLVLAFVPMLHRTIRRVARYQPALAEEDITQQALSFLLQFLRSAEMHVRQTHFAFAISRAVKRQLFEWARREGTKEALLDRGGDIVNPLGAEDFSERHAQLRHFLHRCVTRGDLTEVELKLLIQFKLEGTNGENFDSSNGNASNALRQRRKRLLAKLRRLAR